MTGYEGAKTIICNLPTPQLVEIWEQTSSINDERIPMVRGWIMDEFEARDPEGFAAWIESDNCDDRELRNYIDVWAVRRTD